MPKQIYKIESFHGGLSSNSDPRDIADSEIAESTDLMVDEIGKIRTMGSPTSGITANAAAIQPGYGLFQFSHDRLEGETSGASAAETGDDYLALADTDSEANIDIYSRVESSWGTGKIDLGSTTGMKPCFYYVDGSLRISDGNFGSDNTNQWYGYIDRQYFGGDADETYDAWKSENQLPLAPTDGYIRKHNGAAIWGTASDKPLDSEDPSGTGDGFLRMSIAGAGTSTITTWIELTDYDDSELTGYWYTKYGSWDTDDYSELLDSSMEESHTGAEYFAATFTDANRDSGSDDDNIVVSLTNPSTPSGYDAGVTKMMSLAKHKRDTYSRFAVELDDPINLIDKSIFFNIYISKHMSAIIDYITVYAGTFIGDWDTTTSSNEWIRWKISGTELTNTVSDWQEVEVFTGDTPYETRGNAYLGSIDHFAISIHTLDDADKFGYTGSSVDGDSSYGDCLIYRPRYGDPTEATGWNGKYNFYYSYLYDDVKQESPLIEFNNHASSDPALYYEFTGTPLYLKFYAQQASSKGWNHATSGNARITGANIYYTEVDDSGDRLVPSKYYLCTVDFEKGTRIDDSYDWEAWDGGSTGAIGEWHAPGTNLIKIDEPPTVHTFETKTGYDVSKKVTNLYFKTALVTNRMAYIGNVKYDDEDGKTHTEGDAILKSHINKFDLFTTGRTVEASVKDGDEIIKLEEYADRILQFKKNKMQLINVSQDIEFLEDTFMHKGVNHPSATCKTDFGIAWVNKYGCYLYDGQNVSNLLEKGGRRIIKESIWESFLTSSSTGSGTSTNEEITSSLTAAQVAGETIYYNVSNKPIDPDGTISFRINDVGKTVTHTKLDSSSGIFDGDLEGTVDYGSGLLVLSLDVGDATNSFDVTYDYSAQSGDELSPMIGYVPKKRQIIVVDDSDNNGSGDIYLYDMITQSWVKGDGKYISSWLKTNFINDWNGDLVLSQKSNNGLFYNWSNTSSSSATYSLKTKDIDFGQPSVRKKVYKVYVSYKGDASGVTLNYGFDGDNDTYTGQFYKIGETGASDTDETASDTPFYGSTVGTDNWINAEFKPTAAINNIYSFQLKFDGTAGADFEINDISIVYRLKSVK